jgi:hypothetical protein
VLTLDSLYPIEGVFHKASNPDYSKTAALAGWRCVVISLYCGAREGERVGEFRDG